METKTILLIILAIIVVLFVPLYPLKLIKKILLFLVNSYLRLPIKFDDIGGIPVIKMRLYNVEMPLGAGGMLKAKEMHLRINFWRIITFREPADPRRRLHFWRWISFHRPAIDPLTFYKPEIRIKQIKEHGEVWFLFPLTAMKWVVSSLFVNLWGLNFVRIYRGTVIIEGKGGETKIEDLAGEFTSHGQNVKVRRLSCMVGDGSLEIHYPRVGPMTEGRLVVRNMRLEELVALKVPKNLNGPINIEAAITGPVANLEMNGHISSPALFMRNEPISDFRSPLKLKGTKLILEHMRGRVGEYQLEGILTTDVETDISELRLLGRGNGLASQSVLKILSLKPFIESAELDADVLLEGNLNEFYEFTGDINIKLKNAKIDFTQIGEGTMGWFPLAPIPEASLHLTLQRGVLVFDKCRARSGSLNLLCNGKIDMQYDPVPDKVVRSQFEMSFALDCPDLQDIANMFSLEQYKFTGSAKADFKLDCDYSTIFHKLEGFGHLSAKDVHLAGFPIAKKKIVKTPVDLWFDTLVADLILEKDRFRWENVACAGKWIDITLNGGIGFFDKELSVKGQLGMVPASLQENRLFKLLPGSENIAKRIKTSFRVSGKTDHPNFSLSLMDSFRDIFTGAKHDVES
ncbi:MAG: AsmA-like C-terminal region-containing protein [bacterium]